MFLVPGPAPAEDTFARSCRFGLCRFADGENLLDIHIVYTMYDILFTIYDILSTIYYILNYILYTGSPSLLAASGSSPARCNLLPAALAQELGEGKVLFKSLGFWGGSSRVSFFVDAVVPDH